MKVTADKSTTEFYQNPKITGLSPKQEKSNYASKATQAQEPPSNPPATQVHQINLEIVGIGLSPVKR